MKNNKLYVSFEILKQLRIESGDTQKSIARETCYTIEHVNRFENSSRLSFPLFIHYMNKYVTNEKKESFLHIARNDFGCSYLDSLLDEDKRSSYEKKMFSLICFLQDKGE